MTDSAKLLPIHAYLEKRDRLLSNFFHKGMKVQQVETLPEMPTIGTFEETGRADDKIVTERFTFYFETLRVRMPRQVAEHHFLRVSDHLGKILEMRQLDEAELTLLSNRVSRGYRY